LGELEALDPSSKFSCPALKYSFERIDSESLYQQMCHVVDKFSKLFQHDTESTFSVLRANGWQADKLTAVAFAKKSSRKYSPKLSKIPGVPKNLIGKDKLVCSLCWDPIRTKDIDCLTCDHKICECCLPKAIRNMFEMKLPFTSANCHVPDCFGQYRLLALMDHLPCDLVGLLKGIFIHEFVSYQDGTTSHFMCPKCNGFFSIMSDPLESGGKESIRLLKCFTCELDYCIRCRTGGDHRPLSCAENESLGNILMNIVNDKADLIWIERHTRQCPKCKFYVEKNGGCNHILCQCHGSWDYNIQPIPCIDREVSHESATYQELTLKKYQADQDTYLPMLRLLASDPAKFSNKQAHFCRKSIFMARVAWDILRNTHAKMVFIRLSSAGKNEILKILDRIQVEVALVTEKLSDLLLIGNRKACPVPTAVNINIATALSEIVTIFEGK
jgi:hypothetical protein